MTKHTNWYDGPQEYPDAPESSSEDSRLDIMEKEEDAVRNAEATIAILEKIAEAAWEVKVTAKRVLVARGFIGAYPESKKIHAEKAAEYKAACKELDRLVATIPKCGQPTLIIGGVETLDLPY